MRAGQDRFIARITNVLREDGFDVELHDNKTARSSYEGYSIFSMEPANAERSVTIREAYHPSFHRIEVEKKRWLWEVAQAEFDPSSVNPDRAAKFYADWRARLFGDAATQTQRDGSILIPLQGKLTRHRVFQTCSPVDMIAKTASHFPDRPIHVTLHPREVYTGQETQALEDLAGQFSNVNLSTRPSYEIAKTCDFIVTQNSSVAFMANFFGKPSVLFGKIDFHHIALDVSRMSFDMAFGQIAEHRPDYAAYIWWFWQRHSINLRRKNADDKIRARLRKFGWPL